MARGQSTVRDRQVSKIWAYTAVGHIAKNAGILYGIHELMESKKNIPVIGKVLPDWIKEEQEANVGWDPRESDFGKIRFGNIRYDFWAGDAQFAKAIARVIGDPRATEKENGGKEKRFQVKQEKQSLSQYMIFWQNLYGLNYIPSKRIYGK